MFLPLITENGKEGIISGILKILSEMIPNKLITYPEANVYKNLAYDVRHNLINRDLDITVFNSVEYKKEEDPYYVGGVDLEIQAYLELDIYKHTGIDLETFLSLPIEYAEMIKDMVLVKIDKGNKILDDMDNDLKNAERGLGDLNEYNNDFI